MWWIASALAGSLYVTDGDVWRMDTRTGAMTFVVDAGSGYYTGMEFATDDVFWLYWEDGDYWRELASYTLGDPRVEEYDYTWLWWPPMNGTSSALSWDPIAGRLVRFGSTNPGIYDLVIGGTLSRLGDAPLGVRGATWDPTTDSFLVVDYLLDLYRITNYGAPQWVGNLQSAIDTFFPGPTPSVGELAYDHDLRVFWWVTAVRGIFGIDPITLRVVAWRPEPAETPHGVYGGTSPPTDDTPLQDPELLVTGTCPGTVLVTAVDATPGGQVHIVSGTRSGQRSVPSGPCAGTRVDMANPTQRGTLTANSLGLAYTTIQATQAMCDRWYLQALDVDTCMTTSVRPMP